MSGDRGRPISRRDLFGIFGRSAERLRDTLGKELTPQSQRPAAPEPPAPDYPRRLLPDGETVIASSDGRGGHVVDPGQRLADAGSSLRVTGEGLAEPLMAARVSATHVAVVGGECPVDGSDLTWAHDDDRVHCPSCASRWRLDGHLTRGPADSRLATFLVEETSGLVRFRAV